MGAATAATVRAIRVDETLDAVLSPTHDAWVAEARRLLLPATVPDAAFWDRWWMVRYLNEGFLERFGVERALVRELQPFVSMREMNTLERARSASPGCTSLSTGSAAGALPPPGSRR